MAMRALFALLATAFVATTSPASAAAPWSAPQTVPGTARVNPFTVGISLGNAERGALGFTSILPPATGCTQIASVAGVGRGAPGSPRTLDPYDLAAAPVAYANTRAILLQRRTLNRACTSSRLAVSIASLPGSLGTRRILDDTVRLRYAAVAATASGQAAVAWTEDKGYTGRRANPDRLYLSLRPAGGSFGTPTVLVGSGKLSRVSVAYGEGGDLLVAFARSPIDSAGRAGPRRVQARFRRAGHGFGSIADLGPERGVTDIAGAVSAKGRGFVAWGTQDGGIEANEPFEVYAATKAAGPHSFDRARRLFSGRGSDVDRPGGRLGIATTGENALLAFNGVGDGGPTVGTIRPVLASATSSGGFELPVPVAAGNGMVGGIAAQPDGAATIVWAGLLPGPSDEPTGVFSATRPAGGAFPPTAELVAPLASRLAPVPSVAAPRSGGVVQAAWEELNVGLRVSRRG